MTEVYLIQPTNEGQDLNYVETMIGEYEDARDRALELRKGLRKLLRQGEIDVEILDRKGDKLKKVI
jgi:hypothetical protein